MKLVAVIGMIVAIGVLLVGLIRSDLRRRQGLPPLRRAQEVQPLPIPVKTRGDRR